jgi:hypothetical protein
VKTPRRLLTDPLYRADPVEPRRQDYQQQATTGVGQRVAQRTFRTDVRSTKQQVRLQKPMHSRSVVAHGGSRRDPKGLI